MSEINSQNGKETYDLLFHSWNEYKDKWGTAPDILFIKPIKHAELFKWSALGGNQISYQGSKHFIFVNTEIVSINDLPFDFILLEKVDIKDALRAKIAYSEKIVGSKHELFDGDMFEPQKDRIDIPNEVLNFFS
ncbi:hypothetical protein [Acinetobacter bereziniae]|uniref:hypothetical protein n=1 Tax=Acinetobacter bereziniae TaxID=106648 RepID=UPI0018FF5E54|nr:hypothetical protein [Acinetobacter bereziniae]MBJ8476476.1 hypothetical protein [Acinetobacter bereziniae]